MEGGNRKREDEGPDGNKLSSFAAAVGRRS